MLQDTKTPLILNTANASFRQIITSVFDKLVPDQLESSPEFQDALAVFVEVSLLANGEASKKLQIDKLEKQFALELLESVLTNHHQVMSSKLFICTIRDRICPLLLKRFNDKADYCTAVRVVRVMIALVKHFTERMVSKIYAHDIQ